MNCPSCSAVVLGLICEHCGRLASHPGNATEEGRALDQFRDLLHKLAPAAQAKKPDAEDETTDDLDDAEQRVAQAAHLLRTGFIPDHKEVLIDAGVYCLSFLESEEELESAALARLESIVTKLKLLPPDHQTKVAIAELQAKLTERKAERRRSDRFWSVGCFLLLAFLIAAVFWLVS